MATDVNIQIGYKDDAWFTANPTLVLISGQHVHLSDGADEYINAYKIGDGTTELSDLVWRGLVSKEYNFTVTNNEITLPYIPSDGIYFLNGSKCRIGSTILSIVDNLVTLDDDYTDSLFDAIIKP